MQDTRKFKIAIVGGGVCGLTCALALQKEGLEADIFEASAQFSEIGAGVGFGSNAVRVLQDIGVLDHVLEYCHVPEVNLSSFVFYSGMQEHEFIYDYPVLPEDLGLGLHRAHFLDAILKKIDPNRTHNNKRCVEVTRSHSTQCFVLNFSDGTTHEADVVLGADGIKSAVRGAVTGEDPHKTMTYSNTDCYRGLIPIADIQAAGVVTDLTKRPVCFVGPGKHLISFPIKGGSFINVVAFTADRTVVMGEKSASDDQHWVVPASRDQVLKEFENFGSDVLKILGCIEKPSKWMIHVVYPPLQSYVKDRVALLGDAAHAMLPHLGAGAGQALEDAHLLAKLLGHPQTNIKNVHLVLKAYDHTRRTRAQMIWNRSVVAGDIYDGLGAHGFTAAGLRDDLSGYMAPVWHHEVFADFQDSLSYLQELNVFEKPVPTN